MSQVNVGSGGDRVIEHDRSAEGFSMGMIMAIVMGVALLALVAWYAVFQSGWFSPGGNMNVNITQNQPDNGSGSTGSTGSGAGTTSGSSTGGR